MEQSMSETQGPDKSSRKKKFSLKKIWKKFVPNRRGEERLKQRLEKDGVVQESSGVCSHTVRQPKAIDIAEEVVEDVMGDINEIDKDRIRTSCKEALKNMPEFPSREEVKERIENAHKYYGIKCMYNHYTDAEDPDDKKELQPSWYYILERPLVEQYVLMNNYIRKLSVMASLKNEQAGVEEERVIEEEVSSISSSSDLADFAPDSKIAAKLKDMKKIGSHDSSSQIGLSKLEQELRELRLNAKSEERTVKTNEYTIVIREPAKQDNDRTPREAVPSSSAVLKDGDIQGSHNDEGFDVDPHSSGDHLPDMTDFDLSYNLINGPVERRRKGFGQPSYYHWRGNSTPTKTPLLNMDCQPPVRPRAPGTAKDFLSFRNLELSSEFLDSCRDYSVTYAEECRSTILKELPGPEDDDLDETRFDSATQTEQKSRNSAMLLPWDNLPKNCNAALVEDCMTPLQERSSIIERAVLASDYFRECGGTAEELDLEAQLTAETLENEMPSVHGESSCMGPDPVSTPSVVAADNTEDLSPSFLSDGVLGSSVSQAYSNADFTESESASSIETQIPARHSPLE